mmetsp:Transcript_35857/g.48502  ORF Transcript_35857/g.48502 Transcript_35857/m.48502 type:complete len:362 (-) Transcript_35857:6-1091(-)
MVLRKRSSGSLIPPPSMASRFFLMSTALKIPRMVLITLVRPPVSSGLMITTSATGKSKPLTGLVTSTEIPGAMITLTTIILTGLSTTSASFLRNGVNTQLSMLLNLSMSHGKILPVMNSCNSIEMLETLSERQTPSFTSSSRTLSTSVTAGMICSPMMTWTMLSWMLITTRPGLGDPRVLKNHTVMITDLPWRLPRTLSNTTSGLVSGLLLLMFAPSGLVDSTTITPLSSTIAAGRSALTLTFLMSSLLISIEPLLSLVLSVPINALSSKKVCAHTTQPGSMMMLLTTLVSAPLRPSTTTLPVISCGPSAMRSNPDGVTSSHMMPAGLNTKTKHPPSSSRTENDYESQLPNPLFSLKIIHK